MSPLTAVFLLVAFTTATGLRADVAPAEEPLTPKSDGTKSGLLATLHGPTTVEELSASAKAGLGSKSILPPPKASYSWSLSAGPAYRHLEGTRYRGSSRSQFLRLPSFVGEDTLFVPPIGPGGAIGERSYDNGFVNTDGATEVDGTTWNWGYAQDSQVVENDLVFNATGFESIRSDHFDQNKASRDSKDYDEVRPHIQLNFQSNRVTSNGLRWGFGIAVNETPADHDVRFSNYNQLQVRDDYRIDWTDSYDLQGITPPLAPYSGSYDGPGPIIDNIPSDRDSVATLINTGTARFTNSVSASFHGALFTFSGGPTLSYEREKFTLRAGVGATVSILDWRGSQRETVLLTETSGGDTTRVTKFRDWRDHESGVKLIPGLFAQADAIWHYHESWFLSGFARVDAAHAPKLDVGASSFEFDPSGYTVGLQIGLSF